MTTYFPQQDIKFKPQAGNMMFWPAYWTHPHKGIPAPKETKYIITGWFSYINGLDIYIIAIIKLKNFF